MVLQKASEILLYLPERHYTKKSSFNKMHAQVPSCSGTGACSTHSLRLKKRTSSSRHRLPQALTLADEQLQSSQSPQEIHGNPTSDTDKQLKTLLDDQYQNPISLRKEIQETYTGRDSCVF